MLILGTLFQLMVVTLTLLLLWVYYHTKELILLLLESLMLLQQALNSKCKNGCILILNIPLKPYPTWLLKEVFTNFLTVLGSKLVMLNRSVRNGKLSNLLTSLCLNQLFLLKSLPNKREKLTMLELTR